MTIIGEAFIEVKPDSKGFARSAEQGVLGPLGSVAKKAAGILGGIFVGQKVFSFFGDSVDEAREAQKVGAQTEAVIKSTGAAAGLTATQFSDLATAISNKTGIDDEQIQKAENLLATFTNVRNEVGKGNDIFNQASEALVDMGAALGTDASGSAIQLGKALNDPIRGITALTRVGVTFNDQQREQIKVLQESGDVAGAQRIILAELRKEFGGSAAAQATAGDRLRVTFGNIKEELGAKLLPVIDKVATALADHLPGAMDTVGKVFSAVGAAVGPLVGQVITGVQALIGAFQDPDITSNGFVGFLERVGVVARQVFDFFVRNWPTIRAVLVTAFAAGVTVMQRWYTVVGVVVKALGTVAKYLRDNKDVLAALAAVAGSALAAYLALQGVKKVQAAFAAVKGAIIATNAAMAANPAVLIAAGIAALAAAVFLAYKRIQPFHDAVDAVGRFLRDKLLPVLRDVAEVVGTVLRAGFEVAKAYITTWVRVVQGIWEVFGDEFLRIVRVVFGTVSDYIGTVLRIIGDIIKAAVAIFKGDWGAAWDAIKDIPLAVLGFLRDTIGRLIEGIGAVLSGAMEVPKRLWSAAWDAMKAAPQLLIDFVTGLPGRVGALVVELVKVGADIGGKIFSGIVGAFGALADVVLSPFRTVFRAIAELWNNTVGKLRFEVPSWIPGIGGKGFDVPDIPLPAEPPRVGGGGTALHLASGAVVQASPGRGIVATIGEGSRPELVTPLPDGFLAAMERIANGEWGAGPQIQILTHPGMDKYDVGERVALELTLTASRKGWV